MIYVNFVAIFHELVQKAMADETVHEWRITVNDVWQKIQQWARRQKRCFLSKIFLISVCIIYGIQIIYIIYISYIIYRHVSPTLRLHFEVRVFTLGILINWYITHMLYITYFTYIIYFFRIVYYNSSKFFVSKHRMRE